MSVFDIHIQGARARVCMCVCVCACVCVCVCCRVELSVGYGVRIYAEELSLEPWAMVVVVGLCLIAVVCVGGVLGPGRLVIAMAVVGGGVRTLRYTA